MSIIAGYNMKYIFSKVFKKIYNSKLPFEQRNKIVQKGVITMSCISDSFIAFKFFFSWYIIVKDPVLTSHRYLWPCVLFKALNGLKYIFRQ